MRAPFIEVHAALLVDERLQQFQFGFRHDGSRCRSGCAHAFSRSMVRGFNLSMFQSSTVRDSRLFNLKACNLATLKPTIYRAPAPRASAFWGFLSPVSLLTCRLPGASSLLMSSSTTSRPDT